MADVTFIVPVGPAHTTLAQRALDSIHAQTVPCAVVRIDDTEGRGAGWARNVGLTRVTTPFVVFLDADDWVDPTFVEKCLAIWRPGHYVYSGWWEDASVKTAPTCPWTLNHWHTLTTLIPTDAAQAIGFDETLTGGEDSLFYNQLVRGDHALCGLRLDEPLFHYSADGTRARNFVGTPAHTALITHILMLRRTLLMPENCGSCGAGNVDEPMPAEGQPGDLLAVALWNGNRVMRGPVTGRLYPRGGNQHLMYVDPRDQQARPDLWRSAVPAPLPPVSTLEALANVVRPGLRPAPMPAPAQAAAVSAPAPNFGKALGLYKQTGG